MLIVRGSGGDGRTADIQKQGAESEEGGGQVWQPLPRHGSYSTQCLTVGVLSTLQGPLWESRGGTEAASPHPAAPRRPIPAALSYDVIGGGSRLFRFVRRQTFEEGKAFQTARGRRRTT